jgi:hypothetical protein
MAQLCKILLVLTFHCSFSLDKIISFSIFLTRYTIKFLLTIDSRLYHLHKRTDVDVTESQLIIFWGKPSPQ